MPENFNRELERIARRYRRNAGIDSRPGALGDGRGNVIANLPDGFYWVRELRGDGSYGPAFAINALAWVNIPERSNELVEIVYDAASGRDAIRPASYERKQAQGQYPASANASASSAQDRPELNSFFCTRHPDSTTYGFTVLVYPGIWSNGNAVVFGASGTALDMTSGKPSAGEHRRAVVYVDGGGVVGYTTSTTKTKPLALTVDDMTEALDAMPAGALPVWSWVLDGDLTKLNDAGSQSLRQFVAGPPQPRQLDVTSASATIAAGVRYVTVNYAGAVTLTLPAAADTRYGWELVVKDISGSANTNNITINRAGSDTIDGGTSVSITTDYGHARLKAYSDTAWMVL
jgi:hypothetical protein